MNPFVEAHLAVDSIILNHRRLCINGGKKSNFPPKDGFTSDLVTVAIMTINRLTKIKVEKADINDVYTIKGTLFVG